MERKDFLKQGLITSMGWPLGRLAAEEESLPVRQPPYLKPGDTIAITSPAGYITIEEIKPAILQMQSWGLVVKIGQTIGKLSLIHI